jgi:hypothetical protein
MIGDVGCPGIKNPPLGGEQVTYFMLAPLSAKVAYC